MKPVYLSRHASRRMQLYEITLEQVMETFMSPDSLAPTLKERYNAFRRVENRLLRVTYKEDAERMVVVTVTPLRRGEEGP
ncbi:MAG: DUF4258 domain-containing protein [Chloroflexi bacterium]|nr:DUF4258 domain-containing protein [Chloroflexota bacterium]